MGHPFFNERTGRLACQVFAENPHLAACGRHKARNSFDEFSLSIARYPGKTQNLPPAQPERQAGRWPFTAKPFGNQFAHLNGWRIRTDRRALHVIGYGLAKSTPGEFVFGSLADMAGPLHFSQLEYRHPIRNGEDFSHLV